MAEFLHLPIDEAKNTDFSYQIPENLDLEQALTCSVTKNLQPGEKIQLSLDERNEIVGKEEHSKKSTLFLRRKRNAQISETDTDKKRSLKKFVIKSHFHNLELRERLTNLNSDKFSKLILPKTELNYFYILRTADFIRNLKTKEEKHQAEIYIRAKNGKNTKFNFLDKNHGEHVFYQFMMVYLDSLQK